MTHQATSEPPPRSSALDILGVDNVLFAVGDLEQAVAFYGTALGLPVKFSFPQAGIVGFRLGAKEPGLIVRQGDIPRHLPAQTPRIWLEVADAQAAHAALVQAGIAPLREPFEVQTGWVVEIADSWGNVLGLTDYVKAPERARR